MRDWLSGNWEASWRSLFFFNFYRLSLAAALLATLAVEGEWAARFNVVPSLSMFVLLTFYLVLAFIGVLAARHWKQHFDLQLSAQVLVDILVISALMFNAGGVRSGLGLIMLISLAAASLVGRGRLVLFYAAVATLAALGLQVFGVISRYYDQDSIVQAGFISAGYFATAILARLLGQRVMANEELARRRGIALDNQIKISQRIVERMQDGVLIVTREGELVRCNPMAATLLGLQGEHVGALSLYAPTLQAALGHWLNGQSTDSVMLSGPRGQELNARFEPTASSDGELLVFLEDMERIKDRAQQLKLAALGRLTASIAHEIRNPLSAISHAAELLAEEQRRDVQLRLLRIIGDNTVRLNRIVGDVLELGRQKAPQPESISLRAFCEQLVIDMVAAQEVSPDVVSLQIESEATLCFDRAHLYQVLSNLLGNALRHSSCGKAAVLLSVQGGHGTTVELHVIDDGPGIPEDMREQVFEPFFTTHHQGTGLGLFIARELCGVNAATLQLASAVSGQGAHFIVSGRNTACLLGEMNESPAPI